MKSNEEKKYVYNISVELSESEVKSFFAKAGELNMEPGELIKGFIHDTSSTNLNSRDRGARAISHWYDEMYAFTRTDTLLSYLFRNDCYEAFSEEYEYLLDLKAEIIENPDNLQDVEFMINYKDMVENYSIYIKGFEQEMINRNSPIEITGEIENIQNWRDMNMQSLSEVIEEKENNIEESLSYKAGCALALINLKDIEEQTKCAFEFEHDKLKDESSSDFIIYAEQGLEYLDKLISSFSIDMDRDIMKLDYNQKMKLVIDRPTDALEGYKSLVDKVICQHKEFRKQNSVKMKALNTRIEADARLLSSPEIQKELDERLTHDSNQISFTSRLLNVLQSDYSRFCESVGETVAAESMENQDEEEMYPDL